MSKLTNCPNCGAKWSYEEQETDSCDSCRYPNHETTFTKSGFCMKDLRVFGKVKVFEHPEFLKRYPLTPDEAFRSKPCSGNCGMNYCADNGCLEQKHILAQGAIPLKHNDDDRTAKTD